jgi:general secretion pathway protein L
MNRLRQLSDVFSRWINVVAATVHALLNRWSPQRVVRLTEEEQGSFALQAFGDAKDLILPDQQIRIADGAMTASLSDDWKTWLRGSRAEVVLRPGRFMFRPLELPKRAGEFLEGIVRSQVDRLTPWSVNEAAYTWTPPVEAANDRIQLTVAATARSMLMPYVRAVADLGAASVIVSTVPQDAGVADGALKVYEQRNGGTIEVTRIRQILMMVFLGAAALAVISSGVSSIVGDSLDNEQQDLSHKIAARRAAMRRNADGGAQRMLERRKQTTPAAVMVLDALSKVLPDHTYVIELRIENGKVQVTGITKDAPSLIALIEQSPHFEHATFFAPTTQSPGEPGERFHIEARVKPYFRVDA